MKNLHRKISVLTAAMLLTFLISGCETAAAPEHPEGEKITQTVGNSSAEEVLSDPDSEAAAEASSDSPSDPSAAKNYPLIAEDKNKIKSELCAAMEELRQPQTMDLSEAGLSERPELKYAYELYPVIDGGFLTCEISYMPYKTENFPEEFEGVPLFSLEEFIQTAETNLGEEPVNIRIQDSSLTPDIMNLALQQAGGGYVNCILNRDATQIVFTPSAGMTMDDCLTAIAQADKLAAEISSGLLKAGMTEAEKAAALYAYITSTVQYDRLYYSDKEAMPYASQTALGALRDSRAICGGYSGAVRLLFEKAGIPCYNVTGVCRGEYHMWNIALTDGRWLWYDATADRGFASEEKFRYFALETLDESQYTWNDDIIRTLIQ